MKKRIVIFASGSGTNTQNVIQYFQQNEFAEVVHVFTNNQHAKVLERAEALNVPASAFSKEELVSERGVLPLLTTLQPDLIVLAGFLLKVPAVLLEAFPDKVINIHPALLPNYGGKGMYGMHVHKAVVANKEPETGITIHFVNEHYDEGAVIFQHRVPVSKEDTPEDVAAKIHTLEYEWFPKIIEHVLLGKK